MPKAQKQDTQRPNPVGYLLSAVISVLSPQVIGILAVVLGTACLLAFAYKPQQASKSDARVEAAVKPTGFQFKNPTPVRSLQMQDNQSVKKEAIKKRSLFPSHFSLDDRKTLLALDQHHNQKHQQNFNNKRLQQDEFREKQQANTKPFLEQQLQTQRSLSVTVGSQTSSALSFISPITLLQAQTRQRQQPQIVAQGSSSTQAPEAQPTQPDVETELKPTESTQEVRQLQLTLSDVVVLALENNRNIKNAYLERISQRQDLAVAEDEFVPNFTPEVSFSVGRLESDRVTTDSNLGVGATVSVRIPTGGELSFSWETNAQTSNLDDDGLEQDLSLSFSQPLLRGAGIQVNRAPIEIARLTEQINILELELILSDTITDALVAYRELLRAQRQLEIEERSLELAQENLEITRVLIEAGEIAPVDIIQSETAVANQQVSLLTAQNNLEARRLELLDILDIENNRNIVSAEIPTAQSVALNLNTLKQLAFENRPDYLQAQLTREVTQLALLQAEDNKGWDLNLITTLNDVGNDFSDLRAGLNLRREFGDLTREQQFQRARVNRLQAENTFENLTDSLEIQVTDRIRNVNLLFSQVERAQQARALSERQLEIEREKQRLGRGDGIFQFVRLQEDLVAARTAELNATIDYLTALTQLDQTLGTTLDTWQVTVDTK